MTNIQEEVEAIERLMDTVAKHIARVDSNNSTYENWIKSFAAIAGEGSALNAASHWIQTTISANNETHGRLERFHDFLGMYCREIRGAG